MPQEPDHSQYDEQITWVKSSLINIAPTVPGSCSSSVMPTPEPPRKRTHSAAAVNPAGPAPTMRISGLAGFVCFIIVSYVSYLFEGIGVQLRLFSILDGLYQRRKAPPRHIQAAIKLRMKPSTWGDRPIALPIFPIQGQVTAKPPMAEM